VALRSEDGAAGPLAVPPWAVAPRRITAEPVAVDEAAARTGRGAPASRSRPPRSTRPAGCFSKPGVTSPPTSSRVSASPMPAPTDSALYAVPRRNNRPVLDPSVSRSRQLHQQAALSRPPCGHPPSPALSARPTLRMYAEGMACPARGQPRNQPGGRHTTGRGATPVLVVSTGLTEPLGSWPWRHDGHPQQRSPRRQDAPRNPYASAADAPLPIERRRPGGPSRCPPHNLPAPCAA
jgi:hypothetical protein